MAKKQKSTLLNFSLSLSRSWCHARASSICWYGWFFLLYFVCNNDILQCTFKSRLFILPRKPPPDICPSTIAFSASPTCPPAARWSGLGWMRGCKGNLKWIFFNVHTVYAIPVQKLQFVRSLRNIVSFPSKNKKMFMVSNMKCLNMLAVTKNDSFIRFSMFEIRINGTTVNSIARTIIGIFIAQIFKTSYFPITFSHL